MGRAQIIRNDGEGLYTIEVKHDTTAAVAELSKLNAILSKVEAKIAEENCNPEPDPNVINALEIRKTALEKRIEGVTTARDADFLTTAWCADRTEGLTGEVGTIEPGTEMKNGINIRPGFEDDAAFVRTRDGQATPFLTMGVADAMVNFALMPAIQRWRPTYRYATISTIDHAENRCRVILEPLFSSIRGLDINPQAAYDDVPIEYMSCDATAFEDGDAVIVKFDPYSVSGQPRVIGFKDHPKGCGIILKLVSINGIDLPAGPSDYQLRLTQPTPQTIDHPQKGTYTEDFTVIGSGPVDAAGVVEITPAPGVSIDPDIPLHVGIKNAGKWTYWTTDWRGSKPDRGFTWNPSDGDPEGWYTYPDDHASGEYDFLLDAVQWVRMDVDLRFEDQTQFQDAEGRTVAGYEIAAAGIKLLRRDHCQYYVSDMVCTGDGSIEPGGASTFDDIFDNDKPVNYVFHDYDLTPAVPQNFEQFDWYATFYGLTDPVACHQNRSGFDCYGGDTGEAYKNYHPQVTPASESSMVTTEQDPGILCDRNGKNIQYTQSQGVIDVETVYTCHWIWIEYLDGYRCTNHVTGAVAWTVNRCQPGEGVIASEPCETPPVDELGPEAVIEMGEGMVYEMIDLSIDEI
jgi:hypothetical protein